MSHHPLPYVVDYGDYYTGPAWEPGNGLSHAAGHVMSALETLAILTVTVIVAGALLMWLAGPRTPVRPVARWWQRQERRFRPRVVTRTRPADLPQRQEVS